MIASLCSTPCPTVMPPKDYPAGAPLIHRQPDETS